MSRLQHRRQVLECNAGNLNETNAQAESAQRESWLAVIVELVGYILVFLLPFALIALIPTSCTLQRMLQAE